MAKEFLAWYVKAKCGPSLSKMALSSGKASTGQKRSNRKRTNNERPIVLEQVDGLNGLPQITSNTPSHLPQLNLTVPNSMSYSSGFIPQAAMPYVQRSNPTTFATSTHAPGPSSLLPLSVGYSDILNNFVLKVIRGTTVRSCYGCIDAKRRVLCRPPRFSTFQTSDKWTTNGDH